MIKKIYIIDHIGIHSGMHYYNNSFKSYLDGINDFDIEILSNYNENGKPFFLNQYSSNKISGAFFLVYNYLHLLFKVIFSRNCHFVLLSYGTIIDAIYMTITIISKKVIIDIHEVYALSLKNKIIIKILSFLYKNFVVAVIYHSERSLNLINNIGYNQRMIYVPHFKYKFSKSYNYEKISDDVTNSISKDKLNILSFGYVTYSKGIDLLLNAAKMLPKGMSDEMNLIIAGKDFDGTIKLHSRENNSYIKKILRYINDDELVYLFSNVDYVIFPYRKTSQSGVLEMAIHFRKPMILSNIKYFSDTLKKFPSFGIKMECDELSILKTLIDVIQNHIKNHSDYYSISDVALYEDKAIVDEFLLKFENLIQNRNN